MVVTPTRQQASHHIIQSSRHASLYIELTKHIHHQVQQACHIPQTNKLAYSCYYASLTPLHFSIYAFMHVHVLHPSKYCDLTKKVSKTYYTTILGLNHAYFNSNRI